MFDQEELPTKKTTSFGKFKIQELNSPGVEEPVEKKAAEKKSSFGSYAMKKKPEEKTEAEDI